MNTHRVVRMALVALLAYFFCLALRAGLQGFLHFANIVPSHIHISDTLDAVIFSALLLSFVGIGASSKYRGILFRGIDDWMGYLVGATAHLFEASQQLLVLSNGLYWRTNRTRAWFHRFHQKMDKEPQ